MRIDKVVTPKEFLALWVDAVNDVEWSALLFMLYSPILYIVMIIPAIIIVQVKKRGKK